MSKKFLRLQEKAKSLISLAKNKSKLAKLSFSDTMNLVHDLDQLMAEVENERDDEIYTRTTKVENEVSKKYDSICEQLRKYINIAGDAADALKIERCNKCNRPM